MALKSKQVVSVPFLTGLDESYGAVNGTMSTAPFAWNIRTDYGMFAPAKGFAKYIEDPLPSDATAMFLFADRTGGVETGVLVVGTPTKLLAWKDNAWQEIYSDAHGGNWGFVTYQNASEVLMMAGNGVDSLLYWDGVSESAQEVPGAPCKGRFLCVHFERIFCAGDPENPDRVYYSRAFAPFDWTGDIDHPESGGGFADIPTWDGGRVTQMVSDGQDLVVCKNTTIFRLYGTTPANFTIVPVSGSMGVTAPMSHALSGVTHYFLTENGIATYYGGAFTLMDDRKLPRIFDPNYTPDGEDVHLSPVFPSLCASVADGQQRVLFALPLGPSAQENNAILEYDVARQVFLLRRGFNAIAWVRTVSPQAKLLFMGRNEDDVYVYEYDVGETLDGKTQDCHWETPWLDLSTKYARKRVVSLRMYGTTKDSGAVQLRIQTDKCERSRMLSADRLKGGSVKFTTNAPGERFRFVIENVNGSVFSFSGGIELEVELDE